MNHELYSPYTSNTKKTQGGSLLFCNSVLDNNFAMLLLNIKDVYTATTTALASYLFFGLIASILFANSCSSSELSLMIIPFYHVVVVADSEVIFVGFTYIVIDGELWM
jgi:hypothetical protein